MTLELTIRPFQSPDVTPPRVVPEGTKGAVRIGGQVTDGLGRPVADALVETWQADPEGCFAHPDDPRGLGGSGGPPGWSPGGSGDGGFRGFGRCATDAQGRWAVRTLKPGPVPAPDGGTEAPHLDVSVFARTRPRPGKCLSVVMTPADCAAWTIVATSRATASGAEPYCRSSAPIGAFTELHRGALVHRPEHLDVPRLVRDVDAGPEQVGGALGAAGQVRQPLLGGAAGAHRRVEAPHHELAEELADSDS